MGLRDSRLVGNIKLDARSFLKAHPSLIHDIAGYSLARLLYSHVRISRLTSSGRKKLRKLRNRRRRWFVDNIIMHHKRLHDNQRALIAKKSQRKSLSINKHSKTRERIKQSVDLNADSFRWRNSLSIKDRAVEIRGRIDARKLRARSRWATIIS